MSRQLFLVFALVTTASFGLGGVSQMQLAKMEREMLGPLFRPGVVSRNSDSNVTVR